MASGSFWVSRQIKMEGVLSHVFMLDIQIACMGRVMGKLDMAENGQSLMWKETSDSIRVYHGGCAQYMWIHRIQFSNHF